MAGEDIKVTIKVDGLTETKMALADAMQEYPEATAAALFEEGESIKAASVLLCPVDTGRLRATAYTNPPKLSSGERTVEIGYGTNYALPVHERMEVFHPVGQAKFLEVPFMRAMAGYAERIAKRISEHIRKGTWQ